MKTISERAVLSRIRAYPAFKENEEQRTKNLTTFLAAITFAMLLYVTSQFLHIYLEDGIEPFSKEINFILVPGFFVALLILTLMRVSGQLQRAKKFLTEQIILLNSVLEKIDSQPKKYEDLARKIMRSTDNDSDDAKKNLDEYLTRITVGDYFLDQNIIISKIWGDKSLSQVIGEQITKLQTDKPKPFSETMFKLEKEIKRNLKVAEEEAISKFKTAVEARLINLEELLQ